jgi:glucose-6-phosphate isomerase
MGIWERDILDYRAMAILPYSEPLRFFGQHLQQLICESNGKTVRRDRQPVTRPTSPLIISDVGTNVQHAVFQTVHQGSDVVPVQFLCAKSDTGEVWDVHHRLLIASLIGQTVALAKGKQDEDPAKAFPGSRPSTIVVMSALSPEALGAIFSFYECSVIFQGLFWEINSFDQEGVELGKTITHQAMHAPDALLNAFWDHLR